MKATAAESPEVVTPLKDVFRDLSRAFSSIGEFSRFSTFLDSAINKTGLFDSVALTTVAEDQVQDLFDSGHITLPLHSVSFDDRTSTVLKVRADRPFGAEDLHLMSSLASVLAAALSHARKHGEMLKNAEILAFLINMAPVGLVLLAEDDSLMIVNDHARRLLGREIKESAGLREIFFGTEPLSWETTPRFHFRSQGRLIYGETKTHVAAEGMVLSRAIVLVDMSPEQKQLIDNLERELYRCRWLGKPLSFALLECSRMQGGVLQSLPELRKQLLVPETAGPYDAFRVGVVFPEVSKAAALARLRKALRKLEIEDVRIGLVQANSESSEHVIEEALGVMSPSQAIMRRSLLVHDDYSSVNDMLEMILGRQYDIVKSSSVEETISLLKKRHFDGLITEIELRGDCDGMELVRRAKAEQPEIQTFFTTVSQTDHLPQNMTAVSESSVIRKPFDVSDLPKRVAALLGSE